MNASRRSSRDLPGWTVVAGIALGALGFATPPQGGPGAAGPTPSTAAPSFGTADSNGDMIAVTGVDVTGSSLLYIIDTESRQLSVYQATGGSKATSGLRWVGARRIDLDLQVDGWNDKSEHDFKSLKSAFEKSGVLPGSAD